MTCYSKAIIYTIRTDDGLYVGSTCDFKRRKRQHKSCIYNEKCHHYNYKLYKNIRANDGNYRIELYKPFPCNSKRELEQEEERIRIKLNANLNERRAYLSAEERKKIAKEYHEENREELNAYAKQYHENNRDELNAKAKLYHEKNRDEHNVKMKVYREENKDELRAKRCEIITCECGCKSSIGHMTRHRKTKKHLKLMEQLDIQSPV